MKAHINTILIYSQLKKKITSLPYGASRSSWLAPVSHKWPEVREGLKITGVQAGGDGRSKTEGQHCTEAIQHWSDEATLRNGKNVLRVDGVPYLHEWPREVGPVDKSICHLRDELKSEGGTPCFLLTPHRQSGKTGQSKYPLRDSSSLRVKQLTPTKTACKTHFARYSVNCAQEKKISAPRNLHNGKSCHIYSALDYQDHLTDRISYQPCELGQKASPPRRGCGKGLAEGGTRTARELRGRDWAQVPRCTPEPLGRTTTPGTSDLELQPSRSSELRHTLPCEVPAPRGLCAPPWPAHKARVPSQGDWGRPPRRRCLPSAPPGPREARHPPAPGSAQHNCWLGLEGWVFLRRERQELRPALGNGM